MKNGSTFDLIPKVNSIIFAQVTNGVISDFLITIEVASVYYKKRILGWFFRNEF